MKKSFAIHVYMAVFLAFCLCSNDQALGRDLTIFLNGIEMNEHDYKMVNRVCELSRSGQITSWENSDSGNHYSIIPQPAYSPNHSNQPCRRAKITARADHRTEQVEIIACRKDTGNWIIKKVSSSKQLSSHQPARKTQSTPINKTPLHKWSKPIE